MNIECSAKSNKFKKSSMTTKTQIAMFAVAAIAAMSFSMAPAYATVSIYEDFDAPASGTGDSGNTTASCGTGTCFAKITGSASQDYYVVWYGMYGSNNTCDVTTIVTVEGEGTSTTNRGTISGLHSERININIDTGDNVNTINQYSNCT